MNYIYYIRCTKLSPLAFIIFHPTDMTSCFLWFISDISVHFDSLKWVIRPDKSLFRSNQSLPAKVTQFHTKCTDPHQSWLLGLHSTESLKKYQNISRTFYWCKKYFKSVFKLKLKYLKGSHYSSGGTWYQNIRYQVWLFLPDNKTIGCQVSQ